MRSVDRLARENSDRFHRPALTVSIFFFSVAEPKKEKTEQSANGAVSPSGEPQANQGTATTGSVPVSVAPPNSGDQQKPCRPNTLEARVVARRLILFDSEYRFTRRHG